MKICLSRKEEKERKRKKETKKPNKHRFHPARVPTIVGRDARVRLSDTSGRRISMASRCSAAAERVYTGPQNGFAETRSRVYQQRRQREGSVIVKRDIALCVAVRDTTQRELQPVIHSPPRDALLFRVGARSARVPHDQSMR